MQHILFIVPSLAFSTNFGLAIKNHGLDALVFEFSCGCEACWAGADDADWLRLLVASCWKSFGC